jgi:hypothetical protein
MRRLNLPLNKSLKSVSGPCCGGPGFDRGCIDGPGSDADGSGSDSSDDGPKSGYGLASVDGSGSDSDGPGTDGGGAHDGPGFNGRYGLVGDPGSDGPNAHVDGSGPESPNAHVDGSGPDSPNANVDGSGPNSPNADVDAPGSDGPNADVDGHRMYGLFDGPGSDGEDGLFNGPGLDGGASGGWPFVSPGLSRGSFKSMPCGGGGLESCGCDELADSGMFDNAEGETSSDGSGSVRWEPLSVGSWIGCGASFKSIPDGKLLGGGGGFGSIGDLGSCGLSSCSKR